MKRKGPSRNCGPPTPLWDVLFDRFDLTLVVLMATCRGGGGGGGGGCLVWRWQLFCLRPAKTNRFLSQIFFFLGGGQGKLMSGEAFRDLQGGRKESNDASRIEGT